MHGAQVAGCDYAPASWPDRTYTIIRRVKISVDKLSADPRSRRRRTVAKDQLALALAPPTTSGPSASSSPHPRQPRRPGRVGSVVPQPHRHRGSFREVKHGGGLNHLPSADPAVNSV